MHRRRANNKRPSVDQEQSGPANRRRSADSNAESERSSSFRIGDFAEFPPLSDRQTEETSTSASRMSPTDSFRVCSGKVYGHSLDATAPPFQSVFSRTIASDNLTTQSAFNQEALEDVQMPGDAFQLPETFEMEGPSVADLFIIEKLKQAAIEHRDLQQSRIPSEEFLSDDFVNLGVLSQRSGLIRDKLDTVYLACHKNTGKSLIVRRVQPLHLRNLRAVDICEQWKAINHPNIVQLWSITTANRDCKSVLFAYDYHLNARTLEQFCQTDQICEKTIWSYSVQLVNALLAVHAADLAVKVLEPRRVLVTGIDNATVRINCVGMVDVIQVADTPSIVFGRCFNGPSFALAGDKRGDMRQLGRVIRFMINAVKRHGSQPSAEIYKFAQDLESGLICTAENAFKAIGVTRFCAELSTVQQHKDILEGEVLKELDNGRLLRLTCLVSQVARECRMNEALRGDSRAYYATCFSDELFSPQTMFDLVSKLNKLDIGEKENAIPIGNSFLTYENLKDCFIQIYEAFCRCPEVFCPTAAAESLPEDGTVQGKFPIEHHLPEDYAFAVGQEQF